MLYNSGSSIVCHLSWTCVTCSSSNVNDLWKPFRSFFDLLALNWNISRRKYLDDYFYPSFHTIIPCSWVSHFSKKLNCRWCCTFPTVLFLALAITPQLKPYVGLPLGINPFFHDGIDLIQVRRKWWNMYICRFQLLAYMICISGKEILKKIVEKQFIWREVTWKNVPRHTIVV